MKLFYAVLTFGLVACACGQEIIRPAGPSRVRQLPPEREKRVQELGGWVASPATGTVIRVVNAQNAVPDAAFVAVAESIQAALSLPIEVVKFNEARQADKCFGDKTCAVVLVAESGPSLLVAPEEHWATVNVTKLTTDNPDAGKLASRTKKEIWRAVALAMGAADSMFQPCLMKQITTLAELDAAPDAPCPEPYNKILVTARKLGCSPPRRSPYKHACEQGWAPPPTNDVQRAIWNAVKSDKERGPTNPIKITPPKKK